MPVELTDEEFLGTPPPTDYGLRPDNTPKGQGFLGPLQRPDGKVSTELTVGVGLDGKETNIPLLVPTLGQDEIEHLLGGGEPTQDMIGKAVQHAKGRISRGLSPYATEQPPAIKELSDEEFLGAPTVPKVTPLAFPSPQEMEASFKANLKPADLVDRTTPSLTGIEKVPKIPLTQSLLKPEFDSLKSLTADYLDLKAKAAQNEPKLLRLAAHPEEVLLTPERKAAMEKSLRNQLLGVGEFATSPVGAVAAPLGAIGGVVQKLIAGGFAVDTLYNLIVKQVPEIKKQWGKMTDAQKWGAAVDVLGSTALAGLLTAHVAKGLIKPKPAPEAPPVISPAGPVPPLPEAAPEAAITPSKTVAPAGEITAKVGTVAEPPIPESPATLQEQVRLAADPASTRAAALITPGAEFSGQVPEGMNSTLTKHGTVIWNTDKVTEAQVLDAAKGDVFDNRILGGASGTKPVQGTTVVTTSTPAAKDVQTELVATPEDAAKAAAAQKAAVPGGTTETKPAAQVLAERQDAIEKGQVQGGVPVERPRTDAQREAAEAGTSDSIRAAEEAKNLPPQEPVKGAEKSGGAKEPVAQPVREHEWFSAVGKYRISVDRVPGPQGTGAFVGTLSFTPPSRVGGYQQHTEFQPTFEQAQAALKSLLEKKSLSSLKAMKITEPSLMYGGSWKEGVLEKQKGYDPKVAAEQEEFVSKLQDTVEAAKEEMSKSRRPEPFGGGPPEFGQWVTEDDIKQLPKVISNYGDFWLVLKWAASPREIIKASDLAKHYDHIVKGKESANQYEYLREVFVREKPFEGIEPTPPPPSPTGGEVEHIAPGNTVVGEPPILTPKQVAKQQKYREIFTSSKNAYEALKRSVDEGMLTGTRLEVSKELLKHGDVGVKLATGGEYYAKGWGGKAAGLYDEVSDTVHVYDDAFGHNKAGTVLVHEYIHALTNEAIKSGKYRSELESLFSRAYIKSQREGLQFHGVSEIAFQHARGNRGWTTSGYQMETPKFSDVPHLHEFVAEALSNKKFQDFLARTRSPLEKGTLRTMWDEFVSWLGKSIGIKNTSALHDALRIGLDLASERAKGTPAESNVRGGDLDFLQPSGEMRLGPGEGPGARTAGTPATGGSQIEQLAGAFANKAPAAERAKQLARESFAYGERAGQAKDALSRALSGLKNSGQALWTALTKFEKPDELLKAKGVLSAELETRGWRVREFAKNVQRAIPDKRRRAAIAKWIDAGGDDARLTLGEAATKPQFKQAYRDARNLTPEEKVHAQNIQNYFEARLDEAIDAGVLEQGLEDYLHRIYPKDSATRQKAIAYVQSGILSKNPSLARKRFYEWDYEAEAAGLRPVQDFLPRLTDYETSLSKAIAARAFVGKATQMVAADGRPLIGIKGLGIPVEDQNGVRTGTVIKPLGDFRKAATPGTPDYRGDYKVKEYPALSRWKWVATDTDGKPIFVQGDVAIHPDFVSRFESLLEPSHVRYGSNEKLAKLGRGALGASTTVKQTMLDLSGFHQVQIGLHAMEHRVFPWQVVKTIDFADPKVEGLLKGGVTLGGEFHDANFGEGLFGKSLSQHVPILGPIAETYHNWLFQSFIPRVKMTMALHALERNRTRYAKDLASGRMTEDDLNLLTAKQANAAFGELNYIMLERNKTIQDMARLTLLAPDFLEARGRFVAQALTKYGKEQRVALILGAATLFTLARIANKITDDHYHWEPENLFSLVYKNRAYSLRTVQGDVLHLLDDPITFWMNRLNPTFSRFALEAVSHRDQFGRKRSVPEAMLDTVKNIQPIATRFGRERKLWESIMSAFGGTVRRWNDVDKAFKMAQEWKSANNIQQRGEFIYDPEKDPLRPLKIALSYGEPDAVQELVKMTPAEVQKARDYFQRYINLPFTGSRDNDVKWMKTLSTDQRQTVEAARLHRQDMGRRFMSALAQYRSLRAHPPTAP